jgi:ipoprotein LpqH
MRSAVLKNEMVAGIAGVAMIVAGCVGCSSDKSNSGSSSSKAAPPATPGPKLTIDGENQNISGQVSCTPSGSNINIGVGDAAAGIGAVISTDKPPIVHSVGLGSYKGITLGFSDAAPSQNTNAGAAVDGKSYAIKGTASGVDMTDPQQPKSVTKTFELSVTCP